MKNIFKYVGIIALAAVIGLSMAALSLTGCSNPSNSPNSAPDPYTETYLGKDTNDKEYALKITQNTARYTAQPGDAYELTYDRSKKSTGKVNQFTNNEFTLEPSNGNTFKATVTSKGLKALSGKVKWEGDTTETLLPSGELSPTARYSGGGGGGNDLTPENTQGSLKITGLKDIKLDGSQIDFDTIKDHDIMVYAYSVQQPDKGITIGSRIGKYEGSSYYSNFPGTIKDDGTVELKVWKMTKVGYDQKYSNYTDSETLSIILYIDAGLKEISPGLYQTKRITNYEKDSITVDFDSGVGTLDVSNKEFKEEQP